MVVVYSSYIDIIRQLVQAFDSPALEKLPWEMWPSNMKVPCSIPAGSMLNKQRNLNCIMFIVTYHVVDVGFYNYIEPTMIQLVDIILESQKENAKEHENNLIVLILMLFATVLLASSAGIICMLRLGSKVSTVYLTLQERKLKRLILFVPLASLKDNRKMLKYIGQNMRSSKQVKKDTK